MADDAETNVGVVIPFPLDRVRVPDEEEVRKPTCLDCEHCYAGVRGLFCGMFKESIFFEDVAEDCGEFEPV